MKVLANTFLDLAIIVGSHFFLVRARVSLTQYVVLSARLFQLAYCLNDQAHIA